MAQTEWKGGIIAVLTVIMLTMGVLVIVPDNVSAVNGPTWTAAPGLPINRTESAYAQVGNTLFIMGGGNESSGMDNLAFSYDMMTGDVDPLADMPFAQRGAAAAATNDGRIFVFGGTSESVKTQIYYISNNTWIAGPNMPFGAWQSKAAYMVSDNKIYVAGGENAGNSLNNLRVLNLATMAWSAGTPLPVGVKQGNLVSYHTQLLYFGGLNQTGSVTNETFSYSSGTWSRVKSMPAKLTYAAAVRGIDDQIYIIGGSDQYFLQDGSKATVYAYEPRSNTWTAVASLPVPRENPVAGASLDGNIFCVGGTNTTESMRTGVSLRIASMAATCTPTPTVKTGEPISVTITVSLAYRSLAYVEGEVLLKDLGGTSHDLGMALTSAGQQKTTFAVPQYAVLGSAQLVIPSLSVHDARGFAWSLPAFSSADFDIGAGQPLQDQIDQLTLQVADLQTQLLEQQELLAKMTVNSTYQASQITALQSSISAAQANALLLTSQLSAAQTQLNALQTQTSSSINTTAAWQNLSQAQMATLQTQIDLLNSQINASQQQLGQIRTDTGSVQASTDQKMDSTTGMLALVLMLVAIAAMAVAMVLVLGKK